LGGRSPCSLLPAPCSFLHISYHPRCAIH
jgi:hypothetical protein